MKTMYGVLLSKVVDILIYSWFFFRYPAYALEYLHPSVTELRALIEIDGD